MSTKRAKAMRRAVARSDAVHPRDLRRTSRPLFATRALSVVGLLIGAYLTVLQVQAGGGPIDAPFCDAGGAINCNAVLGSTYAQLFGVPVATWATASYLVVLLLTFSAWARLLVFTCVWIFLFSAYMAAVSAFKLNAVCVFCLSLYTVNLGLLGCAFGLGKSTHSLTKGQVALGLTGFAALILLINLSQIREAATAPPPPAAFVAPPPGQMNLSFVRHYQAQPAVVLRGAERHSEGPSNAALTIHEFVDFRCPMCGQARQTLDQLQRANPDKVRVVFRHYPLDNTCNPTVRHQVHPGACAASVAAECAGEQQRFWQYADLLFADQQRHGRGDFEQYAERLDLDLAEFTACLDDGRAAARVKEDIDEASRIEVRATPTLVINGRVIKGLPPARKLATLVTLQTQTAGGGASGSE